jgi:hypothetical protein
MRRSVIVPEVWLESKSARNGLLDNFNHDQALSTLNKFGKAPVLPPLTKYLSIMK